MSNEAAAQLLRTAAGIVGRRNILGGLVATRREVESALAVIEEAVCLLSPEAQTPSRSERSGRIHESVLAGMLAVPVVPPADGTADASEVDEASEADASPLRMDQYRAAQDADRHLAVIMELFPRREDQIRAIQQVVDVYWATANPRDIDLLESVRMDRFLAARRELMEAPKTAERSPAADR